MGGDRQGEASLVGREKFAVPYMVRTKKGQNSTTRADFQLSKPQSPSLHATLENTPTLPWGRLWFLSSRRSRAVAYHMWYEIAFDRRGDTLGT